MRFRVRGRLTTGQPVILKVDAANPYDAVTEAGRQMKADPQGAALLPTVVELSAKPMKATKSAVYVGAVPTARKGPAKVGGPKVEAPKTEAPKTEAPKTEAPKAEAPKTEAPKVKK